MPIEFEGVLEVNDKGVAYFHRKESGDSILRICGLPDEAAEHMEVCRDAGQLGLFIDVSLVPKGKPQVSHVELITGV